VPTSLIWCRSPARNADGPERRPCQQIFTSNGSPARAATLSAPFKRTRPRSRKRCVARTAGISGIVSCRPPVRPQSDARSPLPVDPRRIRVDEVSIPTPIARASSLNGAKESRDYAATTIAAVSNHVWPVEEIVGLFRGARESTHAGSAATPRRGRLSTDSRGRTTDGPSTHRRIADPSGQEAGSWTTNGLRSWQTVRW